MLSLSLSVLRLRSIRCASVPTIQQRRSTVATRSLSVSDIVRCSPSINSPHTQKKTHRTGMQRRWRQRSTEAERAKTAAAPPALSCFSRWRAAEMASLTGSVAPEQLYVDLQRRSLILVFVLVLPPQLTPPPPLTTHTARTQRARRDSTSEGQSVQSAGQAAARGAEEADQTDGGITPCSVLPVLPITRLRCSMLSACKRRSNNSWQRRWHGHNSSSKSSNSSRC